MPVVRVPEDQFERLKAYAQPLIDSFGDVLARILDTLDVNNRSVRDISQEDFIAIWSAIGQNFNRREDVKFYANPLPGRKTWCQVRTGRADIHFEWLLVRDEARLDVALHFESADSALNATRLASLRNHADEISRGIPEERRIRLWNNDQFGEFAFRIPYENYILPYSAIQRAAFLMHELIDRTLELVRNM